MSPMCSILLWCYLSFFISFHLCPPTRKNLPFFFFIWFSFILVDKQIKNMGHFYILAHMYQNAFKISLDTIMILNLVSWIWVQLLISTPSQNETVIIFKVSLKHFIQNELKIITIKALAILYNESFCNDEFLTIKVNCSICSLVKLFSLPLLVTPITEQVFGFHSYIVISSYGNSKNNPAWKWERGYWIWRTLGKKCS